ncbi:MAG: hypothetical protein V3V56_00635 [bacterium]
MKPVRRTALFLAFSLAAALALAGAAAAHSAPGPGGGWVGRWFGPQATRPGSWEGFRDSRPLISLALQYREDLKLTPDQAEKLEAIREEFARRYRREREEIRNMQADLRKSLRRDKTDLADAEKRIRAIGNKRAGLRLARLRAIERGEAVLAPDQLKKLLGLLRKGSYPARQRHEGGGGWDFRGPGMHFRFGPWGPHHHHEQHHPENAPGSGEKAPAPGPQPGKKDF